MRKQASFMPAMVLLSACLLGACGHVIKQTGDRQPNNMLKAMDFASTWAHPDEAGQYAGMRAYADGHYAAAMKSFRQGARYADKMSQLAIGLMYLNGKGVARDPVTAFAWVAIAAERKFPQFVATRDRIWAGLDAGQREQAKHMLDNLYAEYGDTVAKPRMAHELDYWRRHITGSLLGFDSGVYTQTPNSVNCTGNMIDSGVVLPGCNTNIYADWRMNPKLYFETKDAQWNGQVLVGNVEDLHRAGKNKSRAAPASTNPSP